jgi:asparagine synthase (glutamine-hydrolysing)
MCGINGIIFKKSNVDFEKISQMNNMLQHRGPDLSGLLSHNDLLLGHTRLSILDTSLKGSQPMSNDGRFWIVYNGEVYNYIELREDLIKKNHKFYTNTDTEVILCAYKEWGIKCFEKFNGEWALAILDKQENKLIITRDGIGFKPCYIYEDSKYFSFSSEIKPFYCLNKNLEFNFANLGVSGETLSYNSKTIFKNISQLMQGRVLEIQLSTNEKKLIRWDYPLSNLPKVSASYKENSENYFDLLKQATKLRLRSDVEIGTSLSGGLDSSAIFSMLNLLDKNNQSSNKLNLNPIIMNYDGMKSKNDALELAKLYNKDPLVIEDKEETIDSTKNIISKLEIVEEFFMQYNLYKEQSKRGIKVSIDGHGSDEFLGYPQFFPEYSVDIFNNMINNYNAVNNYGGQRSITRLKNLFGLKDSVPNKIKFMANPDTNNYYSEYVETIDYKNDSLIINDDLDELKNFSYSLSFTYLISYCGWFQFFLNKWDRASMSNSIEIRMPFLDNNLRSFSLALNTEHKIRNQKSKSILRDSFKNHLSKSILEQDFKQGLSQHKFNLDNPKYKNFIRETISEKGFVENLSWNSKKIIADFDSNKNHGVIWRICKQYLMLEGFSDCFYSSKKDISIAEKFNNLID